MTIAVNITEGGFVLAINGDTIAKARLVRDDLDCLTGVDVQEPGSPKTQLVAASAFDSDCAVGVAVTRVCEYLGAKAPEWAERACVADWKARRRAYEGIMGRKRPTFTKTPSGTITVRLDGRFLTAISPTRGADGSITGARMRPALDGPKERYFVGVDGNTIADVIRAAARAIEVYCEELP